MHDTVVKVRKHIQNDGAQPGTAGALSPRFQAMGLSRALAEPFASQFEAYYLEAVRWVRITLRLVEGGEDNDARSLLGDLMFASQHIQTVLDDLVGFLERAEDTLSGLEEITHRESPLEREVLPFSRLESTQSFRRFLEDTAGVSSEVAMEAAQAEGDLMKVVHIRRRFVEDNPTPTDLYAMSAELGLDARRHLIPLTRAGSPFLRALNEATDRLS